MSALELPDRLHLMRTAGIGPIAFRELLHRFDPPSAAIDAIPGLTRRGRGRMPSVVSQRTSA